jgi:hypothetical protein
MLLGEAGSLVYKGANWTFWYPYIDILDTIAFALGYEPCPTKSIKFYFPPTTTTTSVHPPQPGTAPVVEEPDDPLEEEPVVVEPLTAAELGHLLVADAKAVTGASLELLLPLYTILSRSIPSQPEINATPEELLCAFFAAALVLALLWFWWRRSTAIFLTFQLQVVAVRPGFPLLKFAHTWEVSILAAGEHDAEQYVSELLEQLMDQYSRVMVSKLEVSFTTTKNVLVFSTTTTDVLGQWTDSKLTTPCLTLFGFLIDVFSASYGAAVSNPF